MSEWLKIGIVLAVVFFFISGCDYEDSDDANHAEASAKADDDDDNDDNDDVDDDDSSPPPSLPDYQGDGHLSGIACGKWGAILEDGTWSSREDFADYNDCFALEKGTYYLANGSLGLANSRLDKYENEILKGIELQFPIGSPIWRRLKFFHEEFGVINSLLYDETAFYQLPFGFYDIRAINDIVHAGNSSDDRDCLYHYTELKEGDNLISCLDPSFYEPPNELPENAYIFKVHYFNLDDIWVAIKGSNAFPPVFFAHWNGTDWDIFFEATKENDWWSYNEGWIDWGFSDPDNGWALIYLSQWALDVKRVLKYDSGQWDEITIPPAFPCPVEEQNCGEDHCLYLSVVSTDEAWFSCVHEYGDVDDYGFHSDEYLYFGQYLNEEFFFWEAPPGADNISIKSND